MSLLIGLAGRARCGKDTVAKYLVANHEFQQFSFAFPIKEALRSMFGIDPLIDDEHKEVNISWIGRSPRQLYQLLGTEFGRDRVHPDIWVRTLEYRLFQDGLPDAGADLVISDCRFDNEADWIRSKGGQVWHIVRTNNKKVQSHRSEDGIRLMADDKIIDNSFSIPELYQQLDHLIADSGQVTVPL